MNGEESKVVSLFDKSRRAAAEAAAKNAQDEQFAFEEVLRRNLENSERLKKERAKANKNLVRNIRLDPKR